MDIKLILIIMLILQIDSLFHSSIKKLKQKAKIIYKKKFGKEKSWNFLGYDINEYPGTNSELRKIHEEKWNAYYNCLEEQMKNVEDQLSAVPEAILGFEGSTIKLECRICFSPKEADKTDSVEWEWAPHGAKRLQPIEFSEHLVVSPDDKTLHLYNLETGQTGQYKCKMGDSLTVPFFLTIVQMDDTEFTQVHPNKAPHKPYPKPPQVINGYNLILDTEWSDWTTCSKCHAVGKKHKLGYCTISINNLNGNIETQKKTNSTEEKQLEISKPDIELLKIFKLGIPCHSHILPDGLRNLKELKNRTNEIMTGFCKIDCPKEAVFEVKDDHGNIIERANNSEGIYSMLQEIPPLEPPVERRVQYGAKGKDVILTCPGNLNTDAPVQWQIGMKNVIPEILSKESNGRIFISITDKIHIKKSLISDSNIYSCWQQKELAGTVRLVVEKKFEMNFNHHIMLLGIIVILSTFIIVFIKAFFGRKYALIKY